MLSFRRQSISYKVGNHNCRGELHFARDSPETMDWVGNALLYAGYLPLLGLELVFGLDWHMITHPGGRDATF